MVNQAKLQESLEDINVANVNSVGIDINLIVNHEHMQILLSFLSAFGPRKAKNFIQKIKQYGGRISTRGEVYRNNLLPKSCYISSIAFMKVKIPPEDQGSQVIDILDMTRIHIESYRLATKVACDGLDGGSHQYQDGRQNLDGEEESKISENDKWKAVASVMKRPELLQQLSIDDYKKWLNQQG